jgi:F0F1-type ATP synthase assembly protein I
MQQAVLGAAYRKVLILQTIGTILVAAGALLSSGTHASLSALVGGAVVMLGNLAYAFIARPSKTAAKGGSEVLLRHVLAQMTKLGLILLLMLAAFSSGQIVAIWFMLAIGVALLAHWLSMMFPR